jgi:hypothetical protein
MEGRRGRERREGERKRDRERQREREREREELNSSIVGNLFLQKISLFLE